MSTTSSPRANRPPTTVSARSLAGFASFPAITYLAFAFEHRWSALRWPFETAIAGSLLATTGWDGCRCFSEDRTLRFSLPVPGDAGVGMPNFCMRRCWRAEDG